MIRNEKLETIKHLLKEVSEEELMNIRLKRKLGVVLKLNGKLYFLSDSSKAVIAREIFGGHLCGKCEFGSETICPKIMDWFVKVFEEEGIVGPYAVKKAKRIEKYDFIVEGIEAFNTSDYYMIVTNCSKYQHSKPNEVRQNPISRIKIPTRAYTAESEEKIKFVPYGCFWFIRFWRK